MFLNQRSLSLWLVAVSVSVLLAVRGSSLHAVSTTLSVDTSISRGDTWVVAAGDELWVPFGVDLTVDGALEVHGSLLVEGSLDVYGRVSVEGLLECEYLYIAGSGSVEIRGTSRHFGRVRNYGIYESFDGVVSTFSDFCNGGYLFNNGDMLNTAEFENESGGYMINQKYFITDGEFENRGEVVNRYTPGAGGSDATIFENHWRVYNAPDAEFHNTGGIVDNSRDFENDGFYFNTVGGEFLNRTTASRFLNNPLAFLINESGTFDNNGELVNQAALIENGEDGLIINRWNGSRLHSGPFTSIRLLGPGEFVNRGGIQNESRIVNYDVFRNSDGVLYNFCDAELMNYGDFFNASGLVRNWDGLVHAGNWNGPAHIDMGLCWRP